MGINLDGASIEHSVPLPVAKDEVIDRGDLVYWNAGTTSIRQASAFTWETSGPVTRRQFKKLFAGIALDYHRSGDAAGVMQVATIALVEVGIVSRAVVPGELLGPNDASSLLVVQTMLRTQDPSEAIGEVAKDHTTAVTTTKAWIRSNLFGPYARANSEKRTLQIYAGNVNNAADLITDMPAGELFGGPVEILAISAIEIIVLSANANITIDKDITGLAALTVATGGAVGKVTRKDLSADVNRFFEGNDNFTLKSDGGSATGELSFVIEYRPL